MRAAHARTPLSQTALACVPLVYFFVAHTHATWLLVAVATTTAVRVRLGLLAGLDFIERDEECLPLESFIERNDESAAVDAAIAHIARDGDSGVDGGSITADEGALLTCMRDAKGAVWLALVGRVL